MRRMINRHLGCRSGGPSSRGPISSPCSRAEDALEGATALELVLVGRGLRGSTYHAVVPTTCLQTLAPRASLDGTQAEAGTCWALTQLLFISLRRTH